MTHEPLQPAAEQSIDESALLQQFFKMRVTVRAGFGLLPDLQNVQQHQQVEDADHPQEGAGNTGADDSADVLQLRQLSLDGRGRKRNGDRQTKHNGRVAERKEESDTQ